MSYSRFSPAPRRRRPAAGLFALTLTALTFSFANGCGSDGENATQYVPPLPDGAVPDSSTSAAGNGGNGGAGTDADGSMMGGMANGGVTNGDGGSLVDAAIPDAGFPGVLPDGGDTDGSLPDSGPAAPVYACDFANNTGCDVGDRCTVLTDVDAGTQALACVTDMGGKAEGATCEPGMPVEECYNKLICNNMVPHVCSRLCELGGTDCVGANEYCIADGTITNYPDGVVPDGMGVCTFLCNVLDQNCPSSLACYLLSLDGRGQCSSPGAGVRGDNCTWSGECAEGFDCAFPGGKCRAYCDGTHTCAVGTDTCQSLGGSLGLCVP
jgi:hypothetical protein